MNDFIFKNRRIKQTQNYPQKLKYKKWNLTKPLKNVKRRKQTSRSEAGNFISTLLITYIVVFLLVPQTLVSIYARLKDERIP